MVPRSATLRDTLKRHNRPALQFTHIDSFNGVGSRQGARAEGEDARGRGSWSLLCEAPGTDRRLVGAAGGKRLLTPFSRPLLSGEEKAVAEGGKPKTKADLEPSIVAGYVELGAEANFHITPARRWGHHIHAAEDLSCGHQQKFGWPRRLIGNHRFGTACYDFCPYI